MTATPSLIKQHPPMQYASNDANDFPMPMMTLLLMKMTTALPTPLPPSNMPQQPHP